MNVSRNQKSSKDVHSAANVYSNHLPWAVRRSPFYLSQTSKHGLWRPKASISVSARMSLFRLGGLPVTGEMLSRSDTRLEALYCGSDEKNPAIVQAVPAQSYSNSSQRCPPRVLERPLPSTLLARSEWAPFICADHWGSLCWWSLAVERGEEPFLSIISFLSDMRWKWGPWVYLYRFGWMKHHIITIPEGLEGSPG